MDHQKKHVFQTQGNEEDQIVYRCQLHRRGAQALELKIAVDGSDQYWEFSAPYKNPHTGRFLGIGFIRLYTEDEQLAFNMLPQLLSQMQDALNRRILSSTRMENPMPLILSWWPDKPEPAADDEPAGLKMKRPR